MGATTIQWTDAVWNATRGCSRVSPGCGGAAGVGGCYAERQAYRFSGPGQPYEGLVRLGAQGPRWTGKMMLAENMLELPLRWRKPRRIFVNSMSDLFHEGLTDAQIQRVFGVMALAPWHTFQILTKRADRMRDVVSKMTHEGCVAEYIANAPHARGAADRQMTKAMSKGWPWPLPNVHLGVSVEDQERANKRIPALLQTAAAVRWLSCEPLLGPIDLNDIPCNVPPLSGEPHDDYFSALDGLGRGDTQNPDHRGATYPRVNWVVVGGESGPGARPMHPAWARALRDQCVAAGVPYFFKQHGEWMPRRQGPAPPEGAKTWGTLEQDGSFFLNATPWNGHDDDGPEAGAVMYRMGKKASGRLLDGREWNEFPEVE